MNGDETNAATHCERSKVGSLDGLRRVFEESFVADGVDGILQFATGRLTSAQTGVAP
jgi:hypothetical protein